MSYRVIDVLQDYIDRDTGQRSVMAELVADTAADLPANTAQLVFILGSFATAIDTGDTYKINSAGAWILQPSANQFDNVYTKSETDAIVNRIDSDITDAENDISDLHLALTDIINSGGKNKMQVASGQSVPPTRWINIPVVIQPGTYRVFFGDLQSDDTDSNLCQAIFLDSGYNNASNWMSFSRGTDVSTQAVITAGTSVLRLYPSNSYANSQGDTVTFDRAMICDKALWDISPTYAPYCPSLAELYALVKSYHP